MEKLDLLLAVAVGIFVLLAILVYGQFKEASMKKKKQKAGKKVPPQIITRDLNLGLSPEIPRVVKEKEVAKPAAKAATKAPVIHEPKSADAPEATKPLSKAAKRRANKQTPKVQVEKEATLEIKEKKETKAKSPKSPSRAQLKKQRQKEAEKARLLAAEEAKKAAEEAKRVAEAAEKKRKATEVAEKKKKAAEEKKKKLEEKRLRQEAQEAERKKAEAIVAAEKKKEEEKNAEIYRKEVERKWKETQALEAKRKQEEEESWNAVVPASERKQNAQTAKATLSSLNESLNTHEKEIERLRKLKEEKQRKQLEEQKKVELQQRKLQAILRSQAAQEKDNATPMKKAKQNNSTPWGVPVSKLDKDLLRLDTLLDNVKLHDNKIKSLHNRLAKNNAKK